ncbi:hypothetical protein [Glycocaulis abyssi]|uniref:Type II secretion system protein GspC N-terminal domain-containing protein n=1 Tax=Glycocaulis abyssi TaxID=1433403 RepID=A0ABV9NDQ6_9PROT
MMVRLLFASALFAVVAGLALRVMPPAQPGNGTRSAISLPDVSEPPGRIRPVPATGEAGMNALVDTQADAHSSASVSDVPRLVGVTAGRGALSHFEYEGELVTAGLEERIGPWNVRAIDAEGVTVEGPQGMIRLRVYPAETGMEGED